MEKLQIIPLGGLGEVGKNMMALEYGRNILIVDVGMMFPESDMPGVEYIIPDYRYLKGKEDRIRGIIITHGHEDHIGALPHFLQEFDAPVYATRLTRGLIEVKLNRELQKRVKLQPMEPGDVIHLGPFAVEPYHVCHSIPDAVGLGIDTPLGLVVHSGDYKMDHTPVDGWPSDIAKLVEFHQRGVLVLLADSTNATDPGTTPSEASLNVALANVFRQANGRIIVATFASLISRIQQVMEVARTFGRKVAIAGTTMLKNVKMARRLGYLDVPDDLILPLQDINRLPPHQVTIIATGAQGEPRSIMGRLAIARHPSLRIVPGDTVVLSSHTIPGNEETVHRVINRLFQKGANVVYHPVAPVHVSGHASQEEQKMLLNLLRPKFFVPIHGELRHLKQHARLAQEVGIPHQNIAVVENGYILRFSQDSLEVGERVPGGYVFVDGTLVGDAVSPQIIQDREALAVSGVCSVVFTYNRRQGGLIGEPRITARGVAAAEVLDTLIARAHPLIQQTLQATRGTSSQADIERAVERAMSNFFYEQVQSRPEMIVVAVPLG
ncbi:MAG TPA: ribonuclease J [Anaerolineae bacterium]|nr:ribonuclease J [Anaerolineae bacterium]HQK14999.1 ribonuclease J [Anaerolineae bacterium]